MGYKVVFEDTLKVVDVPDNIRKSDPDKERKRFINAVDMLMELTESRIKSLRSKGELSRKAIEGGFEVFGNNDLMFVEPDEDFLRKIVLFTDSYPVLSKKQLEQSSMQIQNTNDVLFRFFNRFSKKLDNK